MDVMMGREFLDGPDDPEARDRRLEWFAQGQWADAAPGSGWLAMQAGGVSRAEVLAQATDDEILGIGRAWKTLENWTFAQKLGVVRELIRRHPLHERDEPGSAAGGLPDEWDPRLHHEVAAALGISVPAAAKLAGITWTLDCRLPGINRALTENKLDPGSVRMIVDETSVLDREDLFARAEKIILAGLPRCRTWADLHRLVQRAVIMADPDGARKRREQAEREHARVKFWRESAGTCGLQGTGLPADEALAANARIEGRARAYKAARIARPMDILRVMAYLDLINEVTIAQRVAWAQDDAAARAAEDDEQAARDARLRQHREKAREKARQQPETARRDPAAGGPAPDPATDDSPASDPGTDGSPGDADPGAGHPGDGPGGSGHDDPDDGHPDGWPADDEPGDGPLPDDPGGDHDDWIPPEPPEPPGEPPDGAGHDPCPVCRGTGGGIGLPVRANLTLPAGAVGWLAQWSSGGNVRGPTRPGGRYRGGPGPCPACGKPGRASLPVLGNLAVPLLTLLGLAERPGEAHGLGPLDPDVVRDLTMAGARHPDSEFCLTIVDDQGQAIGHGCCRPLRGKKARAVPVDTDRVTVAPSGRPGPDGGFGSWIVTLPGAPCPFSVDIDPVPTYACDHRFASGRHDPGGRLRHLVQVRDGKCSFPACGRHARESDFEHAVPFEDGGLTCGCNCHACSRSCHRVKQSRGWGVTKPRPGWTRWTTEAGRTYEQGPWRYPA